jgi:hypothetical protein
VANKRIPSRFGNNQEAHYKFYTSRYTATMVELSSAPYLDDDDTVPFAMASVVDIDAELLLSQGSIVTAQAIAVPSPPDAGPLLSPESSISSFTVEHVPSDQEVFGTTQPSVHTIEATLQELQQQEDPEDERNMAAGAAGAVIGLLIGGPVISVVLGFGSVYYTKQEGATGDLARALGDVALVARDRFRKVDSEHHILEQGRAAAAATLHRVQDAHQRRSAGEQCIRFAVCCWRTTAEFVERHKLVERGCHVVALIITQTMSKVQEHRRRVRNVPCRAHGGGCTCRWRRQCTGTCHHRRQ